jgi:seryl-tRNA synthetase
MEEPSVAKVQQIADEKARTLAQYKATIDPGHRRVKEAEEANRRAQNDVEIAKSKSRDEVAKRLREELKKRSESTVTTLEAELGHYSSEIADLKSQLEKAQTQRKATAVQSLEMASLQKEIAQDEAIENQIRQEITKIEVESDNEARITLFRKAETPHSPDMSKKLRVVGLSGGGALAVVVFGIIWLDLRTRRINSLDEIAGPCWVCCRPFRSGSPRLTIPTPPRVRMASGRGR